MKNSTTLLSKIIVVFIAVMTSSAFSETYQTIVDGSWDNKAVWSTDGGMTSCDCTPSTNSLGDDININHTIVMSAHVNISGGSILNISISGSLLGPTYNLSTYSNSIINISGPSTFLRLTNGKTSGINSSTINIFGIVEIKDKITLNGGVLNLDGGYLHQTIGNINIFGSATFNIYNGAKLELFDGNLINEGLIYICPTCCIETYGNWTNELTGTVTGLGSALTNTGNMSNFGSFSSEIKWCSSGFDFGMPTTEDCTASNIICGGVQLPIELSSFSGVNRIEYNDINWITDSERDNDYFILYRSCDGTYWEEVTRVEGAGNSVTATEYNYHDFDFEYLTYYKLEQVDFNGEKTFSTPISITAISKYIGVFAHPNPVYNSQKLLVSGLKNNDSLNIYNNYGKLLMTYIVEKNDRGLMELSIIDLSSGTYFLESIDEFDRVKRTNFIVR